MYFINIATPCLIHIYKYITELLFLAHLRYMHFTHIQTQKVTCGFLLDHLHLITLQQKQVRMTRATAMCTTTRF